MLDKVVLCVCIHLGDQQMIFFVPPDLPKKYTLAYEFCEMFNKKWPDAHAHVI